MKLYLAGVGIDSGMELVRKIRNVLYSYHELQDSQTQGVRLFRKQAFLKTVEENDESI